MKKTATILLIIVSLLIASSNTFAYHTKSYHPSVWDLNWWVNEMCSTDETNAAIAAKDTWNATSGNLKLNRYSYYSTGSIVAGDGYSELGFISASLFASMTGSSTANAATLTLSQNYSEFDILANKGVSWGNGNSSNYVDREGILAHEFGHALGLDENGDCGGKTAGVNKSITASQAPTMFPYSSIYYYSTLYPCSYYFRTLTQDDINGKLAVESSMQ